MSDRAIIAITCDGRNPVLFYRNARGRPHEVDATLRNLCARYLRGLSDPRKCMSEAVGGLMELGRHESLPFPYKPCAISQLTTLVDSLHVVDANNGTWHPIAIAENEALRDAGLNLDQAGFDVIERAFNQLESGELASWKPEPRPAPVANPGGIAP